MFCMFQLKYLIYMLMISAHGIWLWISNLYIMHEISRFRKQIRYASRKARTYDRFVKADETYDYDPLLAGNT